MDYIGGSAFSIWKLLQVLQKARMKIVPVLFTLTYFFSYTHTLLFYWKIKRCWHRCFPQQIRPQTIVQLAVGITNLGRRFGINWPSVKILKLPEGDLPQKSPESNMWLLVNHTKTTNTLYWKCYLLTAGNHISEQAII